MVGLERGAKLDMYQVNINVDDDYLVSPRLNYSCNRERKMTFTSWKNWCPLILSTITTLSVVTLYAFKNDLSLGSKLNMFITENSRLTDLNRIADLLRAGKCPDAPSYYEILLSEVNIQFKSRDSVYQQVHQVPFILTLYSSMSIPQVIVEVAHHLQQNPDLIQLLRPTDLANPLLKGIPRSSYLRNALRMCPDYNAEHDENDVFYLKRMEWTLYYDVLPMSLADTRGKSIYRINVCSTPNQPQTKALLLSKNALVSEMCHLINPREKIRVFKVNDGSTVEIIGRRCTVSHWLESDADNVYAEVSVYEREHLG